ncbi:MAG: hypothetical protein JO022_11995, partial [Acidobacteriaceae bacterium]|nr:hypothetical protein [Acidobacteriaceae bacterium]
MLRGIIICPDIDLNEHFQQLLQEVGYVHVTRVLDRYPNTLELLRYLRAHGPHVIFVGVESIPKVLEIVREVEKQTPGVQIVALGRQCDSQVLLDLMRAGIREFASLPFDRQLIKESLVRISDVIEARPPAIDTTDNVFSFLPSKAGSGTSTIALNAAVALSRLPETHVLLSDFDLNSGMIKFMLKLENPYGVTDAAEHALHMDESLWPPLITSIDNMDVLHAGRLNPDFRIEPTQIRHMLDFMRRNYQALCFDLSGNLEKYSLEIMHESKKIFLVCTPEIPSLHLAREKYLYLKHLDLQERVVVLLNRCQKRPIITPTQIEELLGVPVQLTFPNDY